MNMLDMSTMEYTNIPITAFTPNDTVIGEVTWMTEDHSGMIYRAFNRIQRLDKHVLVDPTTGSSEVVRERDGTDGWLDNNIVMTYVGSVANSTGDFYLDLSDESGWNHIYLYPVEGGDAVPVTEGEWEVTAMLKVDTARNLVYYLSTEHHSTERHLYSINYATGEKTALVDDTIAGYWSASFSSRGDYYILSYQGPDVPYQEVYSTNSTTEPLSTLVSNEALMKNISSLHLPNITYFELPHPDGFSLNVMQRLPPNFDPTKKYPVLFTPYGGPGAQEVSKRFQTLAWRAYISSDPELEYITMTVDNRGTGYKGRAFRTAVTDHLGRLEPQDQIWAAKELISMHSYIDADKIGIYGHSFGGYLSAKVLEADSDVFSFGLIAAPVTDWRFYDSMYTERYMSTYEQNPAGYNETAVRNATGFANARGGFLIAHGTGDDNVHYQNSAALADLLVGAGVGPEQMSMMAFTDSDHSIVYNGASAWLYKYYTKKLFAERQRKEGEAEEEHQWVRRMVLDAGA
jgi:dipeptidyl-peptidase-4